MTRRVAVIGGGVAGLTAAWALSRADHVTLFEADDRVGGHAHTHDLIDSAGTGVGVDSGFIVHNDRTYPTLLRLFSELGVATQDSEMSMSIRCQGCGLEYAGARGVKGLFAQPSSVLRGRYLWMLTEVKRFHRGAQALLENPDETRPTLGVFLRTNGFSQYFINHFAVPLVSAVWSCGSGSALDYPARYLFEFLANHGMLAVTGSPQWRTVTGGSARYVEKVTAQLAAVRTNTPVRAVRRVSDGVEIRNDADAVSTVDACILAAHADQTLAMLAEPTTGERDTLGVFGYSRNETLLHTDVSVLPRRRNAQASWNYLLADCSARSEHVVVSYDMTRLQRLSGPDHYVVTLGADREVAEGAVLARMVYEHPIFTADTVAARAALPGLNSATLAFAGAYQGWGFHEDGALSGLRAAQAVGGQW